MSRSSPPTVETGPPIELDRVPDCRAAPAIAAQMRCSWGVGAGARFDVDAVCSRLGIDLDERRLGGRRGGAQALLIPHSSGFSIEVDPEPGGDWPVEAGLRRSLRRHRRRFLVCHELAHTLFYRPSEDGPRRLVFDSPRQEAFCDELARSLLVPEEIARSLPFRPASIVELQQRFDVSMEVAVRSAVTADGHRGAAWLFLRQSGKSRVQWTSADHGRTAHALANLQRLIERAASSSSGTARLTAPTLSADALFLASRRQAIVTCPA